MSETEADGTEHTECAVCGYEPDPDRFPPHYVLSLAKEDRDDDHVEAYPFGGPLSKPFACDDTCFLNADRDGFDRFVDVDTEQEDKADE